MDTIIIAYWTQTGNTKAMAEAVGEGVETAGKKADVRHISEVSMDRLREAQAFALGCPAMGAEVLEEGEMEPFVMEVEGFAQGKRIGLSATDFENKADEIRASVNPPAGCRFASW